MKIFNLVFKISYLFLFFSYTCLIDFFPTFYLNFRVSLLLIFTSSQLFGVFMNLLIVFWNKWAELFLNSSFLVNGLVQLLLSMIESYSELINFSSQFSYQNLFLWDFVKLWTLVGSLGIVLYLYLSNNKKYHMLILHLLDLFLKPLSFYAVFLSLYVFFKR